MSKQAKNSVNQYIYLLLFISILFAICIITIKVRAQPTNKAIALENSNQLGVGYAVAKDIPIGADGVYFTDIVRDPSSNTIYALYSIDLIVQINLDTGKTDQFIVPFDVSKLAISPNGEKLYLANYGGRKIHVFDVPTLTFTQVYNVDMNVQQIVVGSNNRLYIVGLKAGPPDGISVLRIINATNGNLIDSVTLSNETYLEHLLEISPSLDTLFVIKQAEIYTPSIRKFEMNNDTLTELDSTDLEALPLTTTISGDGEYLLLGLNNDELVRYDTENLDFVGRNTPNFLSSGGVTSIVDVAISSDVDEYSVLLKMFGGTSGGTLITYSAVDGSELRRYDTNDHIDANAIVSLDNGSKIALLKRLNLEVLVPTSYGIALPLVMSNYCSAPYFDDFSDPSSGWPIYVSTPTSYQYINGEYQIYHTQANRWSAVTVGHVIENLEAAIIDGRITNSRDGIWGIVYGLNNDWSDFYTFEILPQHQIWAAFHFNGQTGWERVATGTTEAIKSGSQANKIKIETNQLFVGFTINGHDIWGDALRPGRVGLTGGSFDSNVDLRFDNYVFADDYCPVPTSLQEMNTVDSFIGSDIRYSHPDSETLLKENERWISILEE